MTDRAAAEISGSAADSVLRRITRALASELSARKAAHPLAALKRAAGERPAPRDLRAALTGVCGGLVAEVKRGSPSKGEFAPHLDASAAARLYRDAGAVAISVLTSRYFFASDADLSSVAEALYADERAGGSAAPPLLRKDFHIDPYQVVEARALGADAYLLIAKTLNTEQLRALIGAGAELGMTAFVEVTDEAETVSALQAGAVLLGINNRDLHTFQEDLRTTERLRPLIPDDVQLVAASGVRSAADVVRMRACDVQGVLVGEALSTASDPRAKIRELFDV
ncbi:MAG: indole-3-glycerol phosphate synthase TrpC [Chloroflexi bacterium]|nr:indole-3-glycerol phosphate synthase TrpC [Chloroflexota bacterium]